MNGPELLRSQMSLSSGRTHLNNAGLAPTSLPAAAAVQAFLTTMSHEGFAAVEGMIAAYEGSRAMIARFVNAEPDLVAHMPTCAAAISQVAFGLAFKPGDEILIWDQEYPSNAYPWHTAAKRSGAKVILAPSEPGWRTRTERLLGLITPRTRVVAVSWVQSRTGAMTDLRPIGAACSQVGAWLVADVIQGLGIIPFDMKAEGVDAACCGTQKWLCSPPGHGFLALKPGRQLELDPVIQGAITYGMPYDPVDPKKVPRPDARRFEPGCPMILGAVGTAAAMELLSRCGVESLNRQANRLAAALTDILLADGAQVLSHTGRPGLSPIVTFRPRQPLG
ncbi:MAG: aminotransferase class V-fold PLP-dependent enzyme, partial [Bdellovibrionales bacterium]|nr:aminotransferase class V-fold PLP-dependent enzyme [Bdellovibrionales bacterium]